MNIERYIDILSRIENSGNMRTLKDINHNGFLISVDGKEMLNLSSNDYLGLASSPFMMNKFRKEYDIESFNYSSSSSRLLSGNHEFYTLLENDLCDMYDKEAALYFNSGYHVNISILPALTTKRDLIIADKLVHASIIDGMRLSMADTIRYRHLDYEHLINILETNREKYENIFIVTESIFSMDGDEADLIRLCDIKNEYEAFLYVDEAHAIGIRGTNGLGCCEEKACIQDIDFIVGACGKAFASVGGFVVCNELFRNMLINTARGLIFSTALPPINIAWTRFILKNMPDFTDMRDRLNMISIKLRNILEKRGFAVRGSSHIIPFICGSNEDALSISSIMCDNGFFVQPIRYPTVAKGQARIRFSLNAAIPDEEYECLFDFLEKGIEIL